MPNLSSPIVQFIITSIIGLLAALASALIPIFIFRWQQNRKEMTYRILHEVPLLTHEEEIRKKIQVFYENHSISNAVLVILRLWNSGNTALKPDDYLDPIRIKFGENAETLAADVISTIPENIKERAKVSLQPEAGSVNLEPLLLNSGDSVTLKIVLAAQSQLRSKIKVETRIIGLKQPRNFEFLPRSIFLPLGRSLTFIFFLLFLSFIIFLILSQYENNLVVKLTFILLFLLAAMIYILLYIIVASCGYSFLFRTKLLDGFKYMLEQFRLLIKYMIYGRV